MSIVPGSRENRMRVKFSTPAAFVGFLLTCMEDRDLGPESEFYQESLNRVFIPRKGKQLLYTMIRGDKHLVDAVAHMAIANGGEVEGYKPIPKEAVHELTVSQLLRAVRLRAIPMQASKLDHVLVTLSNATAQSLSHFLRYVWDLGISGLEIAFVRNMFPGSPSHFIRIFGLKHSDAFHAWCMNQPAKVELYAPTYAGRQHSRFYTSWGYKYPVPGLDRLAELNRELILLRFKDDGKRQSTEWITFDANNVNFFRKAYQFVDLQVSYDSNPLIELEENTENEAVPVELAIVRRAGKKYSHVSQLDRQIDRQRRILQDLEQTRARLAEGEHDEVYFAYRFDQNSDDELNPRLIRLMQQRLGTLSHYEYAYCKPRHGVGYHLVIANRTQRQLGFSLQPADHTYYQPAQWRRWGANLYLPLGMELAPRVDNNDVIPLLLQLLEHTNNTSDTGDLGNGNGSVLEAAAVLWDAGANGRIRETRVTETVNLMSQYRLLNSFQRDLAGKVEQGTRDQLAKAVRATRERVDDELNQLAADLFGHVAKRTEDLDASYSQLERNLRAAEQLVDAIEPKVSEASDLILKLPKEWGAFVSRVIEVHRRVVTPELNAFAEFREQLHVGRTELRALSVRGRNLAHSAARRHEHLQEQVQQCDDAMKDAAERMTEIDELADRSAAVLAEIAKLHRQLDDRIERVTKAEKRAEKMEKTIDQIQSREKAVAKRLEKLRPLYEQYGRKAGEIDTLARQAKARERELLEKTLDLASRREDIRQRCRQIALQLGRIETQLSGFAEKAVQLDETAETLGEQSSMIDAHADVVGTWEKKRNVWQRSMQVTMDQTSRRVEQLKESIESLSGSGQHIARARGHVDKAQDEIAHAGQRVGKDGDMSASEEI